ncbi:MAG: ferredoxin [Lachnospiraceae bacterium]|nr:ferredoxin [Lachnospiraceae bacterium]
MIPCVDQDLCIGCGMCAGMIPDLFEMQDTGKAAGIAEVTEDTRTEFDAAMNGCPVAAISED